MGVHPVLPEKNTMLAEWEWQMGCRAPPPRKCVCICDRLGNSAAPDKRAHERPLVTPTPCQRSMSIPTSHTRELRLREVKELTQGHRGKKGD